MNSLSIDTVNEMPDFHQLTSENIEEAAIFRQERDCSKDEGVIVFYRGKLQGWVNQLRNPENWCPGSVAIDLDGSQWVASGGNHYDGAESWIKIK